MSGMVNDNGFLEEDFQQNLDTLRLQKIAKEVVEDLDKYVQNNYEGQIESALLTRSGHYGISQMADSAHMENKFGYDPEAQEVADLDLCITVSDDIQSDIPEIRNLFKHEDGGYGEFNQRYDSVEINPRILHEGGLVGKLEKAAEEWRKAIPESVNFPDVDGSETSRPPAKFMGYFHQGFTAIKQSGRLEETIDYVSQVITDEQGEVYEQIWDDVWEDFQSRIQFKPGEMDKNAELGKVELAKTNSESLDYDRDMYQEGSKTKMSWRNIGVTDLGQKLKDQVAEQEEPLDWFTGSHPGEVERKSLEQNRLDLEEGLEPQAEPDKEVIRRRVRSFLEDHPDIERKMRGGEYQFAFGSEPLSEYFTEDFEYEMAEGAFKSALGRQLASEESSEQDSGPNAELSDF